MKTAKVTTLAAQLQFWFLYSLALVRSTSKAFVCMLTVKPQRVTVYPHTCFILQGLPTLP